MFNYVETIESDFFPDREKNNQKSKIKSHQSDK